MKRIAGLAILLVLMLHSIGYQWVNDLLLYRADQRMQSRIDAGQYNSDQLIELSVTLSLPYSTNWGEWEAVEGEVVVNDIAYRYVERKLENGVMHVRCLPNMERQQLAMQSFASRQQIFPFADANTTQSLIQQYSTIGFDYDDWLWPGLNLSIRAGKPGYQPFSQTCCNMPGVPLSPPPDWIQMTI